MRENVLNACYSNLAETNKEYTEEQKIYTAKNKYKRSVLRERLNCSNLIS